MSRRRAHTLSVMQSHAEAPASRTLETRITCEPNWLSLSQRCAASASASAVRSWPRVAGGASARSPDVAARGCGFRETGGRWGRQAYAERGAGQVWRGSHNKATRSPVAVDVLGGPWPQESGPDAAGGSALWIEVCMSSAAPAPAAGPLDSASPAEGERGKIGCSESAAGGAGAAESRQEERLDADAFGAVSSAGRA
jgi:hypothetical protein